MCSWAALDNELDRWAESSRMATFWWRDDDAVDSTPSLDRLLGLSVDMDVPVALAVVPTKASPALPQTLEGCPDVSVLQHGYAHRNHAPAGAKATEFDRYRAHDRVIAELTGGRDRLSKLFSDRALPILVPPWNRIDTALLSELPNLGLIGLSTFRPRAAAEAVPGLRQVNCHIDLINWRRTCRFVGLDKALAETVAHLNARREHGADETEPTGLLTHHLDHDPGCWEFLERFLERTRMHPAVRWLNAREAMWTE